MISAGCGSKLQTVDPTRVGFLSVDKYAIKKRHKQLNQVLCSRCVALSNGEMIRAVEDMAVLTSRDSTTTNNNNNNNNNHNNNDKTTSTSSRQVPFYGAGADLRSRGGSLDHGRLIDPNSLRDQLRHVRETYAMVVMVIDLMDVSGSFLGRIRDLVGGNPIILVGTKADLLPRGCNLTLVAEWLLDLSDHRGLNVIGVELISSRTRDGVEAAVGTILRSRRGRDVYVIGAANVGKSAFVRSMLSDMSSFGSRNFDPQATGVAYRPTESPMPGTTLGLLPLKSFSSGGHLFDTPGVHLHHRLPHILSEEELKLIHPTRRIRPFVTPTLEVLGTMTSHTRSSEELFVGTDMDHDVSTLPNGSSDQGPLEKNHQPGARGRDISSSYTHSSSSSSSSPSYCGCFLWGGLIRIDVLEAPRKYQMAFYGPRCLMVESRELIPPARGTDEIQGRGEMFGTSSADRRGGLHVSRTMEMDHTGHGEAICDIAVSGFPGWTTVFCPGAVGKISIRIWTPRGIEACVRPPIPVPKPLRDNSSSSSSPSSLSSPSSTAPFQ